MAGIAPLAAWRCARLLPEPAHVCERCDAGTEGAPLAIPDDVDDRRVVRAQGLVELPMRVRSSGPPRRHDLNDRDDRARVYEQALPEGTGDDVRFDVVIGDLMELWPDLVLLTTSARHGPIGSRSTAALL